jgi:hypothetical protein
MWCSWGLLGSWTTRQVTMIAVIAALPLSCFFCALLQQRFYVLETKSSVVPPSNFRDAVEADTRLIVFRASRSPSASPNWSTYPRP